MTHLEIQHTDDGSATLFVPEKQPEIWSTEVFARIYEAMRPGGVLTTYCGKGAIRRLLQTTGFTVERLAGPIGGKREILRATKAELGRLRETPFFSYFE
jgi:tRNA U34 5-methylaminomethyl-2-thiouridine-forming methyltransferase MnmC